MSPSVVAYPLFFPSVGPMELAVVFVVVLILFGPGKLPQVFKALGEGVKQFKDASQGVNADQNAAPAATPPSQTPQA